MGHGGSPVSVAAFPANPFSAPELLFYCLEMVRGRSDFETPDRIAQEPSKSISKPALAPGFMAAVC